ncbi:MAG: tripartite tricarboxylate transporter TctB family protein [Alphaproteobacteria bacterium]|nr:tripartite tricarboxylate transporter TctB family protein [Alphaproteobacteria bacterium]
MKIGFRELNGDSWVALGLIAANAMFLRDLALTESEGAYVSTTTLPIALSASLIVLGSVLLVWSLLRPAASRPSPPDKVEDFGKYSPVVRVSVVVALTIAYIAALPWFGYFLASGAYLGGLSLMYGNRKPLPILALMVGLPLVLMLFFEKYMIVLLPSARLFE